MGDKDEDEQNPPSGELAGCRPVILLEGRTFVSIGRGRTRDTWLLAFVGGREERTLGRKRLSRENRLGMGMEA